MTLQTLLAENTSFRRLWLSSAGESAADDLSRTLLPVMAVSSLGATAAQVGLLQAAGLSAFLLLSLPMGALIERRSERGILVVADLIRIIGVATLPLAHLAGQLTLTHLLLVALVISVADVAFSSASSVAIPRSLSQGDMQPGYGALAAVQTVMSVAAPAASVVIMWWAPAPLATVVALLGYAFSALVLWGLPARDVSPRVESERTPFLADVWQGVRFSMRDPVLCPTLISVMLWNAGNAIVNTVLVVLAIRELSLSAAAMAAIAGIEAGAAFVASLLAHRLLLVAGLGRVKLIAGILQLPPLMAYPLIHGQGSGAFVQVVLWGCLSAAATTIGVLAGSGVIATVTPDQLLARVMSCSRFLGLGIIPLASVAAGVLADQVGVRSALWCAVPLAACALIVVWRSPMRRWRSLADFADPSLP